ncbi:MAG: DUF192 domain-containing protein [bacterium]
MKNHIWTILFIVIVGAIITAAAFSINRSVNVTVGGNELNMLVAGNAYTQARGLSGIELEDLKADGMIFTFNNQEERTFWMKGMEFNLDVVWVQNGKVMKIDRNVPEPLSGEEPERMYSRPFEVDMVLEFPAGFIDDHDILIGQMVIVE